MSLTSIDEDLSAVSLGPAVAERATKGAIVKSTTLLWVQGGYYFLTGIWPLLSIKTFQMVTGPKTDHLPTGREADHWLVMTAGVLITAIATAILVAAWSRRASPEIIVLAVGGALGLTAIDIIYVTRGVIAPVYLIDAALEIMLLAAWAYVLANEWAKTRERWA